MATETLGTLLVRLLFDDQEFVSGGKKAQQEFARISDGLTSTAVGVSTAITGAFAAAGAAVTGLAVASASIGSAFERQISVVGAIGGTTGAALEGLASEARRLGRETEFTAQQTAEALTVLAQAGKNARQSIGLLPATLAFAQAQSADLAAATELLVSTTNTFASSQVTAAQASDVFTKATSTSQLNFSRLQESLKFAGPQAAAFGVSLEETTAVLAAFAQIGIDGSLAGTAFRGALAASTEQSKEQGEVLAALGLTFDAISPQIKDAAGNAQGLVGILENLSNAGITAEQTIQLFGVRAGPALASLLENNVIASGQIRDTIAELGDAAGTTERQVAQVTDNVTGQFRQVVSRLQDVAITIFATFQGPLKTALAAAVPFLQQIGDAVDDVSDRINASLTGSVDRVSRALGRDGRSAAQTFAAALVVAADTVGAVVRAVTLLVAVVRGLRAALDFLGLTPFLDELAVAVATLAALTTGLTALGVVLGGTTSGVAAFGAATAALGGPVGLAVVAVGALVFALSQYGLAVRDAADDTRALQEVANGLRRGEFFELANLGGGRDPAALRETTAAFAEQQRAVEGLNVALREEVETLAAVGTASAADVRNQVLTGNLVVVGDQLRTVAGIVGDLSPAGLDALDASAAAFNATAEEAVRKAGSLRAQLKLVREEEDLARSIPGRALEAVGAIAPSTRTVAGQNRQIAEQEAIAERAAAAAENIAKQRARAERQIAAESEREKTRIAAEGAAERKKLTEEEQKEMEKAARAAAQAIAGILQAAQDEAAGLVLTSGEQIARGLAKTTDELRVQLAIYLASFAGTEAERAAVVATSEAAIAQIRANAAVKLQQQEREATAAAVTAAESRLRLVSGITSRESGIFTELKRQEAEDLTELQRLASEERAGIEAAADARGATAGARERVAIRRDTNAALLALDESLRADAEAIQRATLAQFRADVDAMLAEFQRAYDDTAQQSAEAFRGMLSGPGFFRRKAGEAFDGLVAQAGEAFPAVALAATDAAKAIGSAFSLALGPLGGVAAILQTVVGGLISDIHESEQAALDAAQRVEDAQKALADARAKEGDRSFGSVTVGGVTTSFGEEPPEITRAREDLDAAKEELDAAQLELESTLTRVESGKAARAAVRELVAGASEFVAAVVENLDEIVLALVDALFSADGLLAPENMVKLAVAIVKAIGEALFGIFERLVEFFKSVFRAATNPFRRASEAFRDVQSGRKSGGDALTDFIQGGRVTSAVFGALTGNAGGDNFVGTSALSLVHAGEGILDAQRNRERLYGPPPGTVGHDNPASPDIRMGLPAAGAGWGPLHVDVHLGGQSFDRATVAVDRSGAMGRTNRANRQRTGLREGFTRPTQTR